MTPQEKANELIKAHMELVEATDEYNYLLMYELVDMAKRHVVITVNAILNEFANTPLGDEDYEIHKMRYWEEVLEETKKWRHQYDDEITLDSDYYTDKNNGNPVQP